MFRLPHRPGLSLSVVLSLLAGCSLGTGPIRATWEYVELTKDDGGHVKEVGDKHAFRSGGDEMYEIKGKSLEVVTVTSAKAKFRLSGSDSTERKEVELQPGNSQDLWLDRFGVRLRLQKIGPID